MNRKRDGSKPSRFLCVLELTPVGAAQQSGQDLARVVVHQGKDFVIRCQDGCAARQHHLAVAQDA